MNASDRIQPSSSTAAPDEDLAAQARPGHGIPSQDTDLAAQLPLTPAEAEREAQSALVGGGVAGGAAVGAAVGVAVGGPAGVLVGGTLGAMAGALGGAAAGTMMTNPAEVDAMSTEPARPAVARNRVCLWYDGDAEAAARFYAETFADSAVGAVNRAPGDYPAGQQGDVLTVEFTVLGIPCLGLNGGPTFRHSEAFSFQVATEDQAETDRLWNAIVGNGGQASACGWCKDRWGLSWQITPRQLIEALADTDRAAAKRAFEAMMQMGKIDIAAIEAARRG